MVLNDVCDYAQDCRQRPLRPLPSGRIDRRQAAALGSLLWALGLAAGWTASWSLGVWHCGAVATTLAGCVLAYDLGGKRTVLGPPLMGACRSLNVLLGMVCTQELRAPWDLPASWLGVAAGIGVYVAGITWFARQEAGISRRSHLLGATTVMACGILLLAGYAILDAADGSRSLRWTDPWIWPLLLLLLTVPVWRRCASAIGQPSAVTHSGRRETRDPHLNSAGRRHLSGDRGPLRGAGRAQSVASVSGPGPLGVFDLRIAGTQTTHRQHTGIAGLP